MKNWFTIGQFSRKVGMSAKALRLYEKIGLIQSHTRGENGYRYYDDAQLEFGIRLKGLKDLGFSLVEIKSLIEVDSQLDFDKMTLAMQGRLFLISKNVAQLEAQKNQIENILTSLKEKSEPLQAQQRRAIMSFYGQTSILVTGHKGLEKTAALVQQHFKNAGQSVPIVHWATTCIEKLQKPFILIVKEPELVSENVENIHPDVIVIKDLGSYSKENETRYLRLYDDVGPHVNTVLNGDDRASIAFAENPILQKGRIFYYSKNRGLESQIKKIGGVVSNGEDVEVYGFNLKPDVVHLKLAKIMSLEDEIALLSSLGAVLTLGLEEMHLKQF